MLGIHIRLNLEYKAREVVLGGLHTALIGIPGHGGRSPRNQTIQHVIPTKVAQVGTEEHRGQLAGQEQLLIELMGGSLHKLDFITQILGITTQSLIQIRVIQTGDHSLLLNGMPLSALVENHLIPQQVVYTLEVFAVTNRPGDRCAGNLENLFHLIHQFDGITGIPVQLVHEGEDWRIPQAGNLHQLDGPLLDTLGTVNHHQTGIHCRQGSVGILGEVFVTRRIQQIHQLAAVRKLHNRGRDRDAPLLLHLHPVRLGMLAGLLALDGAGFLKGLTK